MGACFGELMAGIIYKAYWFASVAKIPSDVEAVVTSTVAIIGSEGNRFALVDVGVNRFINYQCGGDVIYFDLGGLVCDSAVFICDGEVDVISAVIEELMGDILTDYGLTIIA
jgi:hypothetical protein